MFPIRSGTGAVNTPTPDQILYQSIAAAAIHEIGVQAILDTGLLMFHQQAADVYYRRDTGVHIETNQDGTLQLYSDSERENIRKDLINVVMKFHILDKNGLAARLTPLIEHMATKEPLEESALSDPFVKRILENAANYNNSLFNQEYV